jgi:hypothetical protein
MAWPYYGLWCRLEETQDVGLEWHNRATMAPDSLNPVRAAFTLRPSVEAPPVSDADAGLEPTPQPGPTRWRLLAWLAEGTREVAWALELLPRERWTLAPPEPARLGAWPALRHVRHLALRLARVTLPAVRRTLESAAMGEAAPTPTDIEPEDAAWDAAAADAESTLAELAAARFELLRQAETTSDAAWPQVEPLLLRARQHELEHLAALWRIAVDWQSAASTPTSGSGTTSVPLHPADRLS